jgi:hypothetical protein
LVRHTLPHAVSRKSELARRLGWHIPQVDRVLNLQHATRLDLAEAALAALGRSLSAQKATLCDAKGLRRVAMAARPTCTPTITWARQEN